MIDLNIKINQLTITIRILFTISIITIPFLPQSVLSQTQNEDEDIKNQSEQKKESKYYTQDGQYINDFNFMAAGDWGCNNEARDTAINMLETDPEIVLGLGDYSYEKNMKCWEAVTKGIDPQKLQVSFGNHEFESKALLKQYMDYTNLEKQFYSFNYNNVHFLSMSTEIAYDIGSEQYEFVKQDLQKVSNYPSINWIVVYFHQPMYTSETKHEGLETFRDAYHNIFEDYKVDLVLQGHVHNYQRTHPLIYNEENPTHPAIIQTAILDEGENKRNQYVNPEGTIFAIVGTGGKEFHKLGEQAYFTAKQFKEHGFLEVKIMNNGNNLVGIFHSNIDNTIKDEFIIEKVRLANNFSPLDDSMI